MTANVTFVWAEKDGVARVPNAALRFKPPPEAFASASGSGSGRRRFGPGGSASGAPSSSWGGGGGDEKMMDPNRKTVWILRDGKPHPARIETGITDGQFTEVVGGNLSEGDEVITEYVSGTETSPTAAGTTPRPPGMGGGGGGGGAGRRMF